MPKGRPRKSSNAAQDHPATQYERLASAFDKAMEKIIELAAENTQLKAEIKSLKAADEKEVHQCD